MPRSIMPHSSHFIPPEHWRCRWCGISVTSWESEEPCPCPEGIVDGKPAETAERPMAADDVSYIRQRMREIAEAGGGGF
jgi:hypothetical protein